MALLDRTDSPPTGHELYGLDIETDTSIDGLDPAVAAVVAISVVGASFRRVFDGDETEILTGCDSFLRALEPGVIVTWNGARFDLPFLAERSRLTATPLGLRLRTEPRPLHAAGDTEGSPGRPAVTCRGRWFRHRHLDGYLLYRGDVGRGLPVSCGLKAMARMVGITAIELDASSLHTLDRAEVRDYVTSDASAARELVIRRWPAALASVDR